MSSQVAVTSPLGVVIELFTTNSSRPSDEALQLTLSGSEPSDYHPSLSSSTPSYHFNQPSNRSLDSYNAVASSQTDDLEPTLLSVLRENAISIILPYLTIFLLSILGNGLVILTLGLKKRMRTVTNAFLFNLSVSDLLLGVFCMPFTLVGMLMRQFVFGAFMCKIIPYLQAVSISVSSWTLVSMSYERYYAICYPLKSRESRQTWSHTKKMISGVWLVSFITMSPIAILSQLQPIQGTDKWKCREAWPSKDYMIAFTVFLDIFLFVVPLLVMLVTYSRIARTLWKNIRSLPSSDDDARECRKKVEGKCSDTSDSTNTSNGHELTATTRPVVKISCISASNVHDDHLAPSTTQQLRCSTRLKKRIETTISVRCSQEATRRLQQRRIIKMLFVVVLEFFICWTPLHVINTISLIYPRLVYVQLGYKWISFFQLLAFMSACTNPITYCFMNRTFRTSFLAMFRCGRTLT